MNKCKSCNAITTPIPEIEDKIGERLQLCLDCFVNTVNSLDRIMNTRIEA